MLNQKYILVCDDRGTVDLESSSKTWTLGGFAIAEQDRARLASVWLDIKSDLCGSETCELKWKHFFPNHHQTGAPNPLLSKDIVEWRTQVDWALTTILDGNYVYPVTTLVQKDKVSARAHTISKKGRTVLDTDTLWIGIAGQFSAFLEEYQSTGEMWFDQLANRRAEEHMQTGWSDIRNVPWSAHDENRTKLKRISPVLRFFDSETEPMVQIADFISGVFFAASEGDEYFLLQHIDKYFPNNNEPFRLIKIT